MGHLGYLGHGSSDSMIPELRRPHRKALSLQLKQQITPPPPPTMNVPGNGDNNNNDNIPNPKVNGTGGPLTPTSQQNPRQEQGQRVNGTRGGLDMSGAGIFSNDFIQSVASSLDDFDSAGWVSPDGDINFERDFGQWFNPDDVSGLPVQSPVEQHNRNGVNAYYMSSGNPPWLLNRGNNSNNNHGYYSNPTVNGAGRLPVYASGQNPSQGQGGAGGVVWGRGGPDMSRSTAQIFAPDSIQSVAGSLDEFDPLGLFRRDGLDFGQWFNPGDTSSPWSSDNADAGTSWNTPWLGNSGNNNNNVPNLDVNRMAGGPPTHMSQQDANQGQGQGVVGSDVGRPSEPNIFSSDLIQSVASEHRTGLSYPDEDINSERAYGPGDGSAIPPTQTLDEQMMTLQIK